MNRSNLSSLTVAAAVIGSLLAVAPAHARFGKSTSEDSGRSRAKVTSKANSKDSKKSSQSKNSSSHAASSAAPRSSSSFVHAASGANRNETVHGATPVYRGGSGSGYVTYDRGPVYVPHRNYWYRHYRRPAVVVVQPAPVYSTGVVYAEPQVVAEEPPPPPSRGQPLHLELFGTAQPLIKGGMVGVSMKLEGEQAGVDLRFDHLSLLAEDGSGASDSIQLASAAVTWSLLQGEHGRLRLHVGAYSAFAPDITFIAPGGGVSTSLNLFGPFTAEGDAQLAILPFTQLDTRAGLGLRLGIVEARAGMRLVYLNDQGHLDGVPHSDLIAGPYLGVGLVL